MEEERSLGICIGAATLSAVQVRRDRENRVQVESACIRPHSGNPRSVLMEVLRPLSGNGSFRIALTGRKFRHCVNLPSISEPEAVEAALSYLNGEGSPVDAVVSAGGESFLVYVLTREGRVSSVMTGNKCASGTGEFFMQQLGRMGLSPEEAVTCGRAESPYKVSGRCSVFCKSDCTHAMNKGVPKGRIVAGLSEMMAGKILELLRQVRGKRVMLVGGTARNDVMTASLRKEIDHLIIPQEAAYFEALGSAVWALDREPGPVPDMGTLFRSGESSFTCLEPLEAFTGWVEFKEGERGVVREGDRCIIGLDVGSTTTKAVLMRMTDHRILASVYLRTQGDPVQASRRCYEDLFHQLGALAERIEIPGLGVTGSGRQIAGLHALTGGIVNEIIAHAAAALYHDSDVDTIFEIGGQDAKYTYIRNGVPSDYAMNEACSAGTGSFLEEAAKEAMGMEMEAIGDMALRGQSPPNFSDQCAAFIGSDIKTAFHEGMGKEDIAAGLVYSVCMNYSNRVKGNRPVGEKVFMQGGVCYNRAVPIAMAALTGKRMVVPPEPGLMGAFGVALEIKRLLESQGLEEKRFDLRTLKDRSLERGRPFICRGGKEGCDRKCEISRIRIEGATYPFGGACNRWYNARFRLTVDAEKNNFVRVHESLIFAKPAEQGEEKDENRKTIGINKSFMVNACYPLYHSFFTELGLRVVISGTPDPGGIDRRRAPFCYPADLSHGFMEDLLRKQPHYLFLPQVKALYTGKVHPRRSSTCPILQGEPYYLASAFKDHETFRELRRKGRILRPVIDFSGGFEAAEEVFVRTAGSMGYGKGKAAAAFRKAVDGQNRASVEMKKAGLEILRALEGDRAKQAVVLFGRSYNALVPEANMGIPNKFASRGLPVLPHDFLPLAEEPLPDDMYWSTGQLILRGASYVRKHPQLFACFITNFSCGPDSFLLEYFRHLMGRKPFLILELDSHVADAGLETRIEAFLDIVRNFRTGGESRGSEEDRAAGKQAFYDYASQRVVDSRGEAYPLNHPRVHLVFPAMGRFIIESTAAVFRAMGIRATALPPPDEKVLKLGKGSTSCKECLPLQLTVGTLLNYLKERGEGDELLVYFMPSASGPCRFGQYSPYIRQILARSGIRDVALFSLEAENSYTRSVGRDLTLRLWACIVISDVMKDIYSVLLTNAGDRDSAMAVFRAQSERIVALLEKSPRFDELAALLGDVAKRLGEIPLRRSLDDTPHILMTGEIYVRHDDLSRQYLVERLADRGFAVKVSSVTEWVYYTDWCYMNNLSGGRPTLKERTSLFIRSLWMRRYERTIKRNLAQSGLVPYRLENVDRMIRRVHQLISTQLTGEAILTIGAAVTEIFHPCCGVIAIGPFGCMPNRVAEAILSREMGRDRDRSAARWGGHADTVQDRVEELPFLAIESDGNPFPQMIQAKLEVFLLQAERAHGILRQNEGGAKGGSISS
jgi:predicted CoA-substrate-specific enzyme activase